MLVTEEDAPNSGDDRNPCLSDFGRGIEKVEFRERYSLLEELGFVGGRSGEKLGEKL